MRDLIVKSFSIIVLSITLVACIIFRNQFIVCSFYNLLGIVLILGGASLWIVSIVTLGKNFTPSLIPKGFVKTGIYRKIRHPMYIGGFLFYLGIGIIMKSFIGIILILLLVAPLLIYSALAEEKEMHKRYGEIYIDYKKKTLF